MFFLPIRPELCCMSSPSLSPTHVGIMVSHQDSQRLPFSIAESDSLSTLLYGAFSASSNVRFSLSGGLQRRSFEGVEPIGLIEDLRINAQWLHTNQRLSWSMQSKLPNTSDSKLGATDETDWSSMISFHTPHPQHRLQIGAGLAIWGDPNRFASQDDALLFLGQYSFILKQLQLDIAIGGHALSPQNPSQTSMILGGAFGDCRVFKTAGNVGLTPYAPRFGLSITAEYQPKACTSQKGD